MPLLPMKHVQRVIVPVHAAVAICDPGARGRKEIRGIVYIPILMPSIEDLGEGSMRAEEEVASLQLSSPCHDTSS